MTSAPNEATALLLLADTKHLLPLNPVALTQAQATKAELNRQYQAAYVIKRDGSVQKIGTIAILGPWGQSFGRKLLSRMTSAWRISVSLSPPLDWTLDETKGQIVACLRASPVSGEFLDRPREELITQTLAARSVDEIFGILAVPGPEDALDVL